ncbi:OmpA family protein [Fulvivirgaceae bacterium BMA10]|uniref:OmpA family protein n=1 Tax=Splendidivirga corallicola TaxID=3051826 RepID=A0ABT8KI89_9BACT|nr:OmpA family protein [Fulvivirgaceae bacterium BMA10]
MKALLKYTTTAYLITAFGWCFAQHSMQPINLGNGVNSEYEEISPVLSPDGQTLYFVRMNHPENKYKKKGSQDIWYSELDAYGNWSKAERMPDHINNSKYNAIHWISQDGDRILVQGVYSKKGTDWKKRGFSISNKNQNGWGKPVPLKIPGFDNMNDGAFSGAFLSNDEQAIVLCFNKVMGARNGDLFVTLQRKGQKYLRPVKIKALSTKYDEQAPYLSDDQKRLYFSSNRDGNYDIYMSERQSDGWKEWSEPVKVEFGVNSDEWESYFKLINEGKSAYFCSTNNSLGNSDIFMVELDEEKKELPRNIIVKGKVIDGTTNEPLLGSSQMKIFANGNPLPDDAVDLSEASFIYAPKTQDDVIFTATSETYTIDTLEVNLSHQNNDTLNIQLIARSEQIVQTPPVQKVDKEVSASKPFIIKGNIYDKASGELLGSNDNPFVTLNGVVPENISYNTGYYNFEVEKLYESTLKASAPGYSAVSVTIAPSDSNVIIQDFYLEKEDSYIYVYGRILDKETERPVTSLEGLSITIDGESLEGTDINQIDKTYRVRVKSGKIYAINANLSNYFGISENIDLNSTPNHELQKDLYLAPIKTGQTVTLNNILFETGSARLKDESIPELRRVADFFIENSSMVIEISGHTDDVGSETYNQKLSEQRAKSVAKYIVLKGLPVERVEFKGYGESNPVASNRTSSGREQNRRVEFRILED